MTRFVWIIAEDASGGKIFHRILVRKFSNLRVEVRWSSGQASISRLAQQLPKLIEDARRHGDVPDCIVVLHDLDEHQQTNRKPYEKIKEICENEKVIEIVAKDEIEAWLLADNGVWQWLHPKGAKKKPKPQDSNPRPKKELENWLKKAAKAKVYNAGILTRILDWVDGTGEQYSLSLKTALQKLKDARCI